MLPESVAEPSMIYQQSDEIKDLLQFSVSENYFRLRKAAGFSIVS